MKKTTLSLLILAAAGGITWLLTSKKGKSILSNVKEKTSDWAENINRKVKDNINTYKNAVEPQSTEAGTRPA